MRTRHIAEWARPFGLALLLLLGSGLSDWALSGSALCGRALAQGVVKSPDAAVGSKDDAAGRRYFIGIGVETYDPEYFHRLKYAEADVQALGVCFQELGYTTLLMTSKADIPAQKPTNAQNVLDLIERGTKGLESADTLVVFMSGHGVQFKSDPALADGGRESYFCPETANLTKRESLVRISQVLKLIGDAKAERKLLIVDACRNEAISEPARAAKTIDLGSVGAHARTIPKGMLALFSCTDKEKSYEHPELKHGVFSYHLVKYLRGDGGPYPRGQVSVAEMANFVRRETTDFAMAKLNADQSPLLVSPTGITDWPIGKLHRDRLRNSVGMSLALIPAGEFSMGATKADIDRLVKLDKTFQRSWSEGLVPKHRVRVSKPFYLGVHEVTRGQFAQFVKATGHKTDAESDEQGGKGYDGKAFLQDPKFSWRDTGFQDSDDHPAVNVSWNDAVAFCDWLSQKEDKTYRLPTEAEWEYACRAGTTTLWHIGNDPHALPQVANIVDGAAKEKFPSWDGVKERDGFVFTAPVGRLKPNGFGLYDMHGNVSEWVQDLYEDSYPKRRGVTVDPLNETNGEKRVRRGGGWGSPPGINASAYRSVSDPERFFDYVGFRVVLALPEKPQF